jgi:hypothetical protein
VLEIAFEDARKESVRLWSIPGALVIGDGLSQFGDQHTLLNAPNTWK